MFNNDTFERFQKRIAEEWKKIDELITAMINEELFIGLDKDKSIWQQEKLMHEQALRNKFMVEIRRNVPKINEATKEAVEEAIKISNEEIMRITSDNKIVEEASKVQAKLFTDRINNANNSQANALLNSAINNYRASIPKAMLVQDDLYKAVYAVAKENVDLGNVIYKDGKKIKFSSYAEMKIRTELNNAALTNLEETSKVVGAGYFLASEHFDCADDHAFYQGKFYLADGVLDEWNGKYMRLSKAKENGFLTRPNCRHYVLPVTKEQLGDNKLLDELGMRKGHYKPENYDVLQEKNKNERIIRKYKERLQSDLLMLNEVKDETQKQFLRQRINYNKSYIAKWQSRQRETLKGTPIKRDYRREQPGIIVRDAGARYHKNYGL